MECKTQNSKLLLSRTRRECGQRHHGPNTLSRQRRRQSGFTLIETLVASLIVGICLSAMVSLWYFSFRLAANSDAQSIGCNIGRRVIEEVKQTGFQDTAEGTSTLYFDNQGGGENSVKQSGSAYSATVSVVSDSLSGGVPTPTALRTVTVTVTALNTGQTIYTTSTYLARAGI